MMFSRPTKKGALAIKPSPRDPISQSDDWKGPVPWTIIPLTLSGR